MKTLLPLFLTFFVSWLYAKPSRVPIRLADRLILVAGQVGKHNGYMILDTGTSGLILNERHYSGKVERDLIATGAGGDLSTVRTTVVNVRLGQEEWKNRRAAIIDMGYLEAAKGMKLLGLIGGDLFWKFEVTIDFQEMALFLSRKKRGEATTASVSGEGTRLSFGLKGGMPCLFADLHGYSFLFALDTAAEDNLMDKEIKDNLTPWLEGETTGVLRGITGQREKVSKGKIKEMEVGGLSCDPMRTLFADLRSINYNLPGKKIDGILGFEFLRQFRVVINYPEKRIALYPYQPAVRREIAANN